MILPVPTESFNSYRDNPCQVLQVERRCPECKTRSLSRHGSYARWVYFLQERQQIQVFRLRCRPCRLTVSLLPEFLLPNVRYALGTNSPYPGLNFARSPEPPVLSHSTARTSR